MFWWMHHLVEAGMRPAQVLEQRRLSNADAVGLAQEMKSVQVGKRAILLLLREDPMQTIEAYDGFVEVILPGKGAGSEGAGG